MKKQILFISCLWVVGCMAAMSVQAGNLDGALNKRMKELQFAADNFVLAAGHGEIKAVRADLERGINVNVRNSEGKTALIAASAGGHVAVVKLLLAQKNIFPYLTDNNNRTALMEACLGKHVEIVKLLLANGSVRASVGDASTTGTTALMLAVDSPEIVSLLLDTGLSKPEAQDNQGRTALIKASANGNLAVVKMLVKYYENKKDWKRQKKLLFAYTKDGKNARDVARTQAIREVWLDAANRLERANPS